MDNYKDKTLPIDQRVEDLLSRMTLHEKIMQTDEYDMRDCGIYDEYGNCIRLDEAKFRALVPGLDMGLISTGGVSPKVVNEMQRIIMEESRLGIPLLVTAEALHGANAGYATGYPQQIGLAATFNPELGYRMGRGIGTECSAMGVREVLAPVMDLIRDPRYGRTEEAYGEDTYLSEQFAREVVRGMQGDRLDGDDAVAAEPKHYLAYGSPMGGLNCSPPTMGLHDIFAEALPIFEAAIKDGGALNVMCSYNSIDGTPVAHDRRLLTDVLRGSFGMRGFVRSDLGAIANLYRSHFVAGSQEESIRQTMEAGTDVQLFDYRHELWQQGIEWLVKTGRMSEDVVTESARRVLRVKFLLGLMDRPYVDESLEKTRIHTPEHVADALQIGRESMVLLKNDGILPLSKSVKKIAVVGPAADSIYNGDYANNSGREGAVTILQGIRDILPADAQVTYAQGCSFYGEELHPADPGFTRGDDGDYWVTASFYNGPEPKGEPVVVSRERRIYFNWINTKPYAEVDSQCFSVAFTGYIAWPTDFTGILGMDTDDSIRFYLDGELKVDAWGEHRDRPKTFPVSLKAGEMHAMRIEFTNDARGARVILGYSEGKVDMEPAVAAAREADVAVVCVGDNIETCGENVDRMTLDLPGRQPELVRRIYETGTPVVLVMKGGRPVTFTWEDRKLPAILEAWFPGEQGGRAVAETLFGDNDPSGRLPISFPRHVGQVPCHYSRKPGGGRRYVEMDLMPLYPFGHGMSYTHFSYDGLKLDRTEIAPGEPITLRFTVRNAGDCRGVAVPQLYIRDILSSVVKPEKELCGFTKLALEPGESREVTMTIGPRSMRTLGQDFVWRIEPGEFLFFVGESSERAELMGRFTVLGEGEPAVIDPEQPSVKLHAEGLERIDNFFKTLH